MCRFCCLVDLGYLRGQPSEWPGIQTTCVAPARTSRWGCLQIIGYLRAAFWYSLPLNAELWQQHTLTAMYGLRTSRGKDLASIDTDKADPSGRAAWGVGLRPLACRDHGFESRRRHGCLYLVSVVCCQVEVCACSWSLVCRNPTEYVVCVCVGVVCVGVCVCGVCVCDTWLLYVCTRAVCFRIYSVTLPRQPT